MATVSEAASNSTVQANQVAREAVRHYMDETVTMSQTYFSAMSSATQASLRAMFDLQNATIQASLSMLDSFSKASRGWLDESAESLKKQQDSMAKLVTASFAISGSVVPSSRV